MYFWPLLLVFLSQHCYAAKVHGRITFGGLLATERFADLTTGSDKNDVMVASTRYFTRVSEVGDSRWDFTTDLRDTHDFFDKLDREKLQLTSRNIVQIKQFNARFPNAQNSVSFTLGRFPIPEAGSANVDGAQLGYKFGPQLNSFLFGGLNPKRTGQTYMQWNEDSKIYGLGLNYQEKKGAWEKNFYWSHWK